MQSFFNELSMKLSLNNQQILLNAHFDFFQKEEIVKVAKSLNKTGLYSSLEYTKTFQIFKKLS